MFPCCMTLFVEITEEKEVFVMFIKCYVLADVLTAFKVEKRINI